MLRVHHDGPDDVVAQVAAGLREMSRLAQNHPAKAAGRGGFDGDPGAVHARFSCTGPKAWMSGIVYTTWDRVRRVRLTHRCSGSSAFSVDAVLPRTSLSALADRLPAVLDGAAAELDASTGGPGPGDPPPHEATDWIRPYAMALHGGAVECRLRSADAFNPPVLVVRDAGGTRLPIVLTRAGADAVAALGRMVSLTVAPDGVHAIDPLAWRVASDGFDAVEAMRAAGRGGEAPCRSLMR